MTAKTLTREEVLDKSSAAEAWCNVEHLGGGGRIRIRSLRLTDRSELLAMEKDGATEEEKILKLALLGCIQEGTRAPFFRPDDGPRLMEHHAGDLATLAEAIVKLSGFDEDPVKLAESDAGN